MNRSTQGTESLATRDSGSTARSQTAPRKSRSNKPTRVACERPISVRFEPEMIERLDRVATRLSSLNLNIRIGRSSVVKLAMARALATLEAELSIATGDARPDFAD
jgi:hypothetical protein